MRGADMVVKSVERQGVDLIFGLPGGAAMPIFDALVDSRVDLILTRHGSVPAQFAIDPAS